MARYRARICYDSDRVVREEVAESLAIPNLTITYAKNLSEIFFTIDDRDLIDQNARDFFKEILKGAESLGVLREATLERVIVTEAGVEREMLEEFPNPSTPLEECGPGCGCGH